MAVRSLVRRHVTADQAGCRNVLRFYFGGGRRELVREGIIRDDVCGDPFEERSGVDLFKENSRDGSKEKPGRNRGHLAYFCLTLK